MSCADVLATYAERKAGAAPTVTIRKVARPKEALATVERLLDFWGDMTLADVDTDTCEDFIVARGTAAGARRDLQIFQAAINMAVRGGKLREIVKVSLPEPGAAREGYLTDVQVRDLLRYCWRHQRSWRPPRGPNKGKLIKIREWPYRHLVPFILTSLYTASRSARVWRASYEKLPGHPWLDLEAVAEIADFASMTEAVVRRVYKHHHPASGKAVARSFINGKAGRRKRTTASVSGGNEGETA